MEDLDIAIAQLREKKLEATNLATTQHKGKKLDRKNMIPNKRPTKKDDGIIGVIVFQSIIALIIVINYILGVTFFNEPVTTVFTSVIQTAKEDFTFKQVVYDNVANILTYVNKIAPIELVSDVKSESTNINSIPTSETTSSASSVDNDSNTSVEVKDTLSEKNENVTVTPANVNLKFEEFEIDDRESDSTMPSNATFAQIKYVGKVNYPLPAIDITSDFGYRTHPITNKEDFHKAIDIRAKNGTPILPLDKGVVIKAEFNKSLGNYILIDHQNGFFSIYGHCSKLLVKSGDKVKPTTVIGKVGSTGDSTGAHLHFAVRKGSTYFDPTWIL